jgi:hypothetical protein
MLDKCYLYRTMEFITFNMTTQNKIEFSIGESDNLTNFTNLWLYPSEIKKRPYEQDKKPKAKRKFAV